MSFLDRVRFDRALHIQASTFVHNYKELASELRLMADHEFRAHLDSGAKIVAWIAENYGDEALLSRLRYAGTREAYAETIERRIIQLEREAEKEEARRKHQKIPLYVDIIFFVVFFMVLMMFLRYVFFTDTDSTVKKLEDCRSSVAVLNGQLAQYSDRISRLEVENAALLANLSLREEEISPPEAAVPAPRDRISGANIKTNGSMIVIYLNGSVLAEFTNTGSMLPVLDSRSTGIEIVPGEAADIYPGDIVSYALPDGTIVIHRVLEVGYDDQGWYAYTKGDNNPLKDRDKVRFSQVQGVLVGILY
jgi:hypothetical protein